MPQVEARRDTFRAWARGRTWCIRDGRGREAALQVLKDILKTQPALFRRVRALRTKMGGRPEPEMGLIPYLADPRRAAVDVGAANGAYLEALIPHAASLVGFEANPDRARDLTRLYGRQARIICAAVSSTSGRARLRIPGDRWGLATIAPENDLSGAAVREEEVAQVTLDELGLPPVGFIKIDIEGHELEALKGAAGLLARDRPALLVEAEERHRANAVASVRAFLEPFGYAGFMLADGRIAPIERFDPAVDQGVALEQHELLNSGSYTGRYVNNFVFVA